MTSKVHEVRRSFAPQLVNLTYVCSVLWYATLDKNTCGTFDLFLIVLVRMGIFYSIKRCGQIRKIPRNYTLPFP